jgi:hypothetical protein
LKFLYKYSKLQTVFFKMTFISIETKKKHSGSAHEAMGIISKVSGPWGQNQWYSIEEDSKGTRKINFHVSSKDVHGICELMIANPEVFVSYEIDNQGVVTITRDFANIFQGPPNVAESHMGGSVPAFAAPAFAAAAAAAAGSFAPAPASFAPAPASFAPAFAAPAPAFAAAAPAFAAFAAAAAAAPVPAFAPAPAPAAVDVAHVDIHGFPALSSATVTPSSKKDSTAGSAATVVVDADDSVVADTGSTDGSATTVVVGSADGSADGSVAGSIAGSITGDFDEELEIEAELFELEAELHDAQNGVISQMLDTDILRQQIQEVCCNEIQGFYQGEFRILQGEFHALREELRVLREETRISQKEFHSVQGQLHSVQGELGTIKGTLGLICKVMST